MIKAAVRTELKLRTLSRRIRRKHSRVLYRGAGYARTVMKNRIRSAKKKTSRSPKAPKGKTGKLKRGVAFDVDVDRGEALVGFTKFRSDQATPLGGRTITSIIDRGGRERISTPERVIQVPDRGRDATGRFTGGTKQKRIGPRSVIAHYGPRPLVDPVRQPAEEKLRSLVRETPL